MSSKENNLIILGAGGHGKVIADIAENSGYKSIKFLDDNFKIIKSLQHWDIISEINLTNDFIKKNVHVFVAIGNNKIRYKLCKEILAGDAELQTLIHPSATISRYSVLGSGTAVMANAVINPFSRIGEGCIINTASVIEHDCIIEDGVHISPGAKLGGSVLVGKESWIGIGASIKNNIKIGSNVIVGAGAVVISDINDNTTVAGIPAKPIN